MLHDHLLAFIIVIEDKSIFLQGNAIINTASPTNSRFKNLKLSYYHVMYWLSSFINLIKNLWADIPNTNLNTLIDNVPD